MQPQAVCQGSSGYAKQQLPRQFQSGLEAVVYGLGG